MCGIFCCISKTSQMHNCIEQFELRLFENRGPNSNQIREIDNAVFGGFVLWHQGTQICSQPVESHAHLLLLNGDIFSIHDSKSEEMSDSEWVFKQLSDLKTEDEFLRFFKTIEGPFSIIFYDKLNENLYFARDPLGRNSLLIENNDEHFRLLSTSRISSNTMELPPLGIYKIKKNYSQNCILFPWRAPHDEFHTHLKELENFCKIKIDIGFGIEPDWFLKPCNIEEYNFNFYDMAKIKFSSTSDLYESFLNNEEVYKAINGFSRLLEMSVKNRVQYTTKTCTSCLDKKHSCCHSKIAILFSGGIDCTILALLSDKYINQNDSIDLVNVAFENTKSSSNWNVPDRITAKSSYLNLKDICPNRKWNFIEVNVTKAELHEHLTKHIKHLIYPLNTVLDESLGCAFWFSSRAEGLKEDICWTSSARVAIVGSGADELFGGYVRHKNAYIRYNGTESEKQENLLRELNRDWNRIPSRNLARDDRVISDNGKTARAPFIEEHLVNFVKSLKPSQRCCFLFEDGIGDKLFLRLYGYYLGLTSAAFLKKRAIQFGSRIANKKQNGANRSMYLV